MRRQLAPNTHSGSESDAEGSERDGEGEEGVGETTAGGEEAVEVEEEEGEEVRREGDEGVEVAVDESGSEEEKKRESISSAGLRSETSLCGFVDQFFCTKSQSTSFRSRR